MKCMSRITKTLLGGGLGLVLGLALAVPAVAQTTITVDFDALDTSGGPVSGATLDDYLAGSGTTPTIPAGGGTVFANAAPLGGPNNVVAPSQPNILEQTNGTATGGVTESYTLVFDLHGPRQHRQLHFHAGRALHPAGLSGLASGGKR